MKPKPYGTSDPKVVKKVKKKAKGFAYPLQDYAAHKLGFGATNPITQTMAEQRQRAKRRA